MASSSNGDKPSVFDMPVNKLTGGGLQYIRALRELKLQEALLEAMIRQYELVEKVNSILSTHSSSVGGTHCSA